MLLTLTLNPCLDRKLVVPHFDMNDVNRARVLREKIGGKGINVSRMAKKLGAETRCLGFDFGGKISEALEKEELSHQMYKIQGALRSCMKILDKSRGHTVEINEIGSSVSEKEGKALFALLLDCASRADFITLSGSLPEGLSPDFYAHVIEFLQKNAPTCRVALDTSGTALKRGLEASPYLIKPNFYEFQSILGETADDLPTLAAGCNAIRQKYGIAVVCLSLGARGAIFSAKEGAYYAPAPKIPVKGETGAGDALLAGVLVALLNGSDGATALRQGILCAAATVAGAGPDAPDMSLYRQLSATDPVPVRL